MKRLLPVSIALLASGKVCALEIYKSDKWTLDIGGNIQPIFFSQENSDGESISEVLDNGSRIHFDFSSPISESTQVRGYFEWYVNIVASDSIDQYSVGSNSISLKSGRDDVFTNRQGFFSVNNDTFGRFKIGKVYSVYQHVTGVTDIFNVYSATASATYVYGDGGPTGTGRSDQTIQWSDSWNVGKGAITLELQGQFTGNIIDVVDQAGDLLGTLNNKGSLGTSLIYKNDALSFGISYVQDESSGDINGQTIENPNAVAGSFSYQTNNLYFAAVANTATHLYQDDLGRPFNGSGYEIAFSYTVDKFKPMIGWNSIHPDSSSPGDYTLDFLILTLNYQIPSLGMFTFIEGALDSGTKSNGADSNRDYIAIGLYYPF